MRREGAGRAIAAGGDDLELAAELRLAIGEIGDVACREIIDEAIGAALRIMIGAGEHDLFQPAHLVGAEGHRALRAHLHAGPAIVVMRGGDHGHSRNIELELREIGHRRQRQADVMDPDAGGHEARRKRQFDRGGIGAIIVAGHDLRLDAHFLQQRAKTEAEGLDAHQIDFLSEKPARVIFAKAGRLHQGSLFVSICVRGERLLGLRKHKHLGKWVAWLCERATGGDPRDG